MPYEDLLSQGRLVPQGASPRAIQDLLRVAERDIRVADHTLEVDPDWAFSIAYNAVLQAGRAFMLSQGYRTRGADQHATVVHFLRSAVGDQLADDVATFDRMRRKRHRAVYEGTGRIGKAEAEQAISFAGDFLAKMRKSLNRIAVRARRSWLLARAISRLFAHGVHGPARRATHPMVQISAPDRRSMPV